jgi:hypothetical protein
MCKALAVVIRHYVYGCWASACGLVVCFVRLFVHRVHLCDILYVARHNAWSKPTYLKIFIIFISHFVEDGPKEKKKILLSSSAFLTPHSFRDIFDPRPSPFFILLQINTPFLMLYVLQLFPPALAFSFGCK